MSSLNVAGTIFTIVFAMPLFIAVILPLAVVYYFVQKIYVATARQVQQVQVNRATNGCFQQFFKIIKSRADPKTGQENGVCEQVTHLHTLWGDYHR